MTAPIDDKVVSASFESGKFESGVARTISAIRELKDAMKFGDAGKGFDQLNAAAGKVDLSNIASGVENISSKFHVLGAVGFTVIQDLTNGVIGFGKHIASGLINPLVQGGKQRALNIEQAKFQFAGLGQNIKKSMASALEAVKGTSFGLDEAAKTAAQFGAAGITAGSKMTGALKGVAGIAALTNSSFGDISQIFTTIAGAGKINSEQLYQFATRGLNVAAALGKQMGKSEQQIRQMVTEGKITFPVFAKAMDDAFGKHAKEANKTFSGSLANMHAALARIGADAWTPFLKASRNVFNTLSPFFDNIHTAIQPLLDAFGTASLGGAKKISDIINGIDLKPLTQAVPHILGGLKNIFKAVGQVAKPLKEAFRDIFPKQAGDNLVKFSVIFERFTKALIPSKETADALRKTFRGLFAIFDIGIQIVKGIFSVFGDLFHAIAPGAGGFLHLTGSVSDFLVALDLTLKRGGALQHFFDSIGAFISKPIKALSSFAHALGDASVKMDPFQKIGDSMKTGLQDIANGVSSINWKSIFTTLAVGFTAGLGYFIKQAFSGGALSGKLIEGIFGSILRAPTMQFRKAMNSVTLGMKSMQVQIQSKTIRNIAVSIALLAGSLVAMSLVDPKRLQNSLSVMAVAFGELLGAMKILDNISKSAGFVKLPFVASSLILLAVALDTLVIAVMLLSRLSWTELEKGLGGVATLLLSISAATGPISANSAGMIRAGVGITAIAVAMNILALAVKQMGALNLSTLGKGLGGVATALIAIGLAMNLFPPSMVAIGLGLVGVGAGMKLLAGVIKNLGGLNLDTLAKGIGAVGIALAAIGIAMNLMPPNLPITAAGLILVGVALKSITGAIGSLGGMSMKTLAKGIGSLAIALGLLAIAAIAMNEGIAGAAGIAIMAGAIAILAPALKSLGDQSWGQIIKGLVSLAAAFAVLAAAGILLAPAAPAILALGGALIAVGAGVALVGAGIALIGIGLSAIAVAGPAAIKILVDALVQLVEVGPKVAEGLVKSFITAVQGIADAGPKLVESIAKIIGILADAIVQDAPKVALAFTALIQAGLKVVNANIGDWVATGIHILEALLSGISKNIGKIVTTAADIVIRFLNTIATKAGDIVSAGLNIVVKIATGMANGIGKVATVTVKIVTKFLGVIASSAGKFISAGVNIIVKVVQGISNAAGRIATAAFNTVAHFVERMASAFPKFVNRVATAMINMINASAAVVRGRSADLVGAMTNIGSALVEGLITGIIHEASRIPGVIAQHITSVIPGFLKHRLGIKSPSTVTHEIGVNLMEGLANGIKDGAKLATTAAHKAAKDLDHVLSTSLSGLFGDNFIKGISGGVLPQPSAITQQIKDTFSNISNKLRADIKTQRDIIKKARDDKNKAQKELDAEEKKPKKKRNEKTIARLNDQIDANNKSIKIATYNLSRLGKGHDQVATEVKHHRTELIKLAKQLDAQNQKLDEANKALDDSKQAYKDAQQARDDYIKSETDAFSTLPDIAGTDARGHPISGVQQVKNYTKGINDSTQAVSKFGDSLNTLLGMGLNDDTYTQLLNIGPAAQTFVDGLISMGKGGVDAINAADASLIAAAGKLADRAGHEFFDASVKVAKDAMDAGQAVVDGLINGINGQPGIKKLQDTIDNLVNGITKRIKDKLKIKSPSQVFAEIGTYTVQGLAQGLVDPSGLKALDKSLSYISDYMQESVNPTITPVLDLTHVKTGVAQLNGMLGASTSLTNASGIFVPSKTDANGVPINAATIKFEQNNYSPESLSAIDIYRQTKNQLSQAKQALRS